MKKRYIPLVALGALSFLNAEVSLPNIFSDYMVLQRDQTDPIWGKADPGEKVQVTFGGQILNTKADKNGQWRVELEPMPAGGPIDLFVKGEDNEIRINNVLIGEVWLCSGQSNMGWTVNKADDADIEKLMANNPQIRLLNVPRKGTQDPQDDQAGKWTLCTPETVGDFSAVGYYFGRRLQETLDVPVGLINNAWGGSSAEAWVPRDLLDQDEQYQAHVDHWEEKSAEMTDEKFVEQKEQYQVERAEWEANGKKGRGPRWPTDPRYNQHRASNIYNGMVLPIVGYGVRGMIWYQGESNSGRYASYEDLINLMVTNFREQWGQGDFPFYFVQLADFHAESEEPTNNNWAFLREAQTKTMDSLENSGQAVIIDVGEGRDIHPRNKKTVADRLARWALANDYGYDIQYRSPQYASMEVIDIPAEGDAPAGKAVELTFDYVTDRGLYSFDTKDKIEGFAIAGEDKQFVWADAKIIGKDKVHVWSADVPEPVAVRYGWAINPVVNLQDRSNGLPVTPFRTDDWPNE
ncbi:sialate O-acetylesterase [Cerasicoccus maritimus]|uniref:sialate O-acetylesterase n=1 Tax=Cerasicoccus maritimus TaxID=490089 RepID=UPI0028525DE0|nr:sialate O-acetylesterase [Cerasicoccus maritimus]